MQMWLLNVGMHTMFIEPGSPWDNEYVEWSNGKLREELPDREVLETPLEARAHRTLALTLLNQPATLT